MELGAYNFYHTKSYKLTLCVSVSVFFYVFLIFFLPFGVDNYNPKHEYSIDFLLEIFYFFLVVLSCLTINEFLLRPLLSVPSTIKSIIIWSIWTLVFLSSATYLTYNILGDWHDFKVKSYFEFIVNCSSVFIFPMIGTFSYFQLQATSGRKLKLAIMLPKVVKMADL